jgi:hypothetical protein
MRSMASGPNAKVDPKSQKLVPPVNSAPYSRRAKWHIFMAATKTSVECHPEERNENYFQPKYYN